MSDLIKKSNSIIDDATSEIMIFERPSRATSSALIDVNKEMQSRITELEQQLKQQWVSVDDRLPDLNTNVLVHVKTTARILIHESRHSILGGWQCGYGAQITHWMPLPKKPTK